MKLQAYSIMLWGLFAAGIVACQESLTTPGGCPDSCPGGTPDVRDTVFDAVPLRDSAFRGYVLANQSLAFLVSDRVPGVEARGLIRFDAVADTQIIGVTRQTFRLDSLDITLAVDGRDTTVKDVWALLYRLPPTLDTTATFPEVDNLLTVDRLIDSIKLPDTAGLSRGVRIRDRTVLASLFPAQDSGVVTLGVRIRGNQPTGVRVASVVSGATRGPQCVLFTTGTNTQEIGLITSLPIFSTYVVRDAPRPVVADELVVGGVPSARSLIRFAIPPRIRDSVTLVRALLELDTVEPVNGIPNDPARVEVRGVVGDFGAKSVSASNPLVTSDLAAGAAGTVQVNVLPIVALWRGGNSPQAFFLQVAPEAGVFSSPVFRSTRATVGRGPRLRISFVVPTNPERP